MWSHLNDGLGELLPCPFCGETPAFPDDSGTQHEIWCNCGMAVASVQISDLMSVDERYTSSFKNFRHEDKYIERAKQEAIKMWNTRFTPNCD